MPDLVWIDEMADFTLTDHIEWVGPNPDLVFSGPVPKPGKWQAGKWKGGVPSEPVVVVSPPPGPLPSQPKRPEPRWRRDLRRVPALKSGIFTEMSLELIEFGPTNGARTAYWLRVDGIPWRGNWTMSLDIDNHVEQQFSSYGYAPMAIVTQAPTYRLEMQNLSSHGQRVTFELKGRWDSSINQQTGVMTLQRIKSAE